MRNLLQLACVFLICGSTLGQDVTKLYGDSDLEKNRTAYSANLRGLWEEDFLSRLTLNERSQAGKVTLSLPLVGANRSPFDWYSDPKTRQVFLPISSVRFLDDLAVSFAYFGNKSCDVGVVTDYAAVLRFRPEEAAGSPLVILGIPSNAVKDAVVDDTAQKLLKSMVYFIAAHEYAHVMYKHKPYGSISAHEAQQQELDADAFALTVMRRISVPPLALTFFFAVASRLEPTPGDFNSREEYELYLRNRATHPVNAARIKNIAEGIERNLDAFTILQPNPQMFKRKLQVSVAELRAIADGLDDRKMRVFLAKRAQDADIGAFRSACRP